MNRWTRLLFGALLIATVEVAAQPPASNLYQYNYSMINPAFAGLDGDKITLAADYFASKNGARTNGGFAEYEFNAKKINSGFAFTASQLGSGADSRSYLNFLYNYQWSINEKNKLVFGAKFSDFIETVNFNFFLPLDPNDPLLNAPDRASVSNLLFGLGAVYKTGPFFVGISSDNLARREIKKDPYIQYNPFPKKFVHYMAGVNFKITSWLSSTHSVYASTMDEYWRVDLNNTFTISDWILAGLSFAKSTEHDDVIPRVNAGINLKDKGQLMLMLYSKDYDMPKKFSAQIMMQFRM